MSDTQEPVEVRTEFGSRVTASMAEIPDVRRRVNSLNILAGEIRKMSPDDARTALKDSRLPVLLLKTFWGCNDLHQTVKDIMRHVLEVFISKGPKELKMGLQNEIRDVVLSKSQARLQILGDLMACRVASRELLSSADMVVFVREVMIQLKQTATEKWETTAEEIKNVSELILSVALIQRLLELVQPAAGETEVIIEAVSDPLFAFQSSASNRHPELFHATSSLLKSVFAVSDSSPDRFALEKLDPSQPGYSGVLLAHLSTGAFDGLIQASDDASFNNMLLALDFHPVCGTFAVVAFAERLVKVIASLALEKGEIVRKQIESCRSRLVQLWTALHRQNKCTPEVNHALLTKSVDVLTLITPMWPSLSDQDRNHIFHSIRTLPCFSWTTIHGQKSWVLLLRFTSSPIAEKPHIQQLLKTLPLKYYGAPLTDLITLLASPEEIADILVETTEFSPYLIKNVLPALLKRSGFPTEAMRLLAAKRAYAGYGPILFTLRSVKIANLRVVRAEIFRDYIKSRAMLAMVAEDLARLEIFGFFCDMAEPMADFDQFTEFIRLNMNHQFAKFREPFLQSIGRFLRRLEETYFSATVQLPNADLMVTLMRKLFAFFTSTVHQCVPSSSYARRNMALHVLQLLLDGPLGMVTSSPQVWGPLQRTLMEQLFWESFPDNQALVVDILHAHSDSTENLIGGFSRAFLAELADTKARSCVANDCKIASCLDRLARGGVTPPPKVTQEILDQLKTDIAAAKRHGMLWAARNSPLYGQILRLRNNLTVLEGNLAKSVVQDVMEIRIAISELVSEALVYHSGGLSMDKKAVLTDCAAVVGDETPQETTAQMLFVCCWRCIREVALLLGDVCCGKLCGKAVSDAAKAETLEWMVSQLLITSHTGAFDSLAEQIHRICRVFMDTDSPTGLETVKQILNSLLVELRSWTSPLKPENTRKSAGLPRLLALLFVALKKTDDGQILLQSSMEFILSEAGGATSTVTDNRVRTVNIMEAVFKQNALSEQTETFMADGFVIACDGMASGYWSVRNAAASLFTALMQRIFGPAVKQCPEEMQWRESCLPAARFFGRYPKLFDYSKNILIAWKKDTVYEPSTRKASKLHSVLLILQRLYSDVRDPTFLRDLTESLRLCLGHPEMRVRQAASMAFALFSSESGLNSLLSDFPQAVNSCDDHFLHGALLTLWDAEESFGFLSNTGATAVMPLIDCLLACLSSDQFTHWSTQSRTLIVRILRKASSKYSSLDNDTVIHQSLIHCQFDAQQATGAPGLPTFLEEYCRLLLSLKVRDGLISTTFSHLSSIAKTSVNHPGLLESVFTAIAEVAFDMSSYIVGEPALLDVILTFPVPVGVSVASVQMALIDGLVRNSAIVDRTVLRKIWERVLSLLDTAGDAEVICRALELTSTVLLKFGNTASEMELTYVMGVKEVLVEGCPVEIRLSLAKHLPSPRILTNPEPIWSILIDLLRDDDQAVRNQAARRLTDFYAKGAVLPCTPQHAISTTVDGLVQASAKSGRLTDLLLSLVATYVERDDRIGGRAEPSPEDEVVVFEYCDRHEYHENLWLIDQVCAGLACSGDAQKPASVAGDDEIHHLVRGIRDCGQFLRSTPFLADIQAYSQTAFRMYCLVAVAGAVRQAGGWPTGVTVDLAGEIEVVLGGDFPKSSLVLQVIALAKMKFATKIPNQTCQRH